jgi:hypothetical protein
VGLEGAYYADPTAIIDLTGASITASALTLSAQATANFAATPGTYGGIQATVAYAKSTAEVKIVDAQITAGSLTVNASSNVSITAEKVTDGSESDSDVDAGISVVVVDADALAYVSGASVLDVAGAVNLQASNTIDVTSAVDGSAGGAGAALAIGVVVADTRASIDGAATVDAGSISLGAASNSALTVTAISTPGGATDDGDAGTTSKTQEGLQENDAETSEGSVDFAAALAVSVLDNETVAYVASSGAVSADGALQISAQSTDSSSATADGSATAEDGDNFGIAVAINVSTVTAEAYVGGSGAVTAASLALDAGIAAGATFTAQATSGASGGDTSVAGAVALNFVTTRAEAEIRTGASVSLSGNLGLTSSSTTNTVTRATPHDGGMAGDLGVGASFALAIIDNVSSAEIENNAAVSGADNVTLAATGSHEAETKAEAGGQSAGTGIGGAIAIAVVDNVTAARIGTGDNLEADGAVTATANHHGASTVLADGSALGEDAAIGAALAFGFVNNRATSTTNRNLTAPTVSFTASGDGASIVTAKASAKGESSGGGDADSQKGAQTDFANDKSGKTGTGNEVGTSQSASSDSGSVSVAAALALNVSSSTADASVNGVTINGDLTLAASNNMDAKAIADGSATDGDDRRWRRGGDQRRDHGEPRGPGLDRDRQRRLLRHRQYEERRRQHTPRLRGEGHLGRLGRGRRRGGLVRAHLCGQRYARRARGHGERRHGCGRLTAASTSKSDVTATGQSEGADTGVGASIAINVSDQLAEADVANGAMLNGGSTLTLGATGSHDNTTTARGGVAGGTTSVGGGLAVSVIDNVTRASIGTGGALTLSGAASATATHHGKTETTTDGSAEGDTAIGVSLALAFVDDAATATVARSVTAPSVTLTAAADGASIVTAKASAKGASDSEATDANDQESGATSTANSKSGKGDAATGEATTNDGGGGGDSIGVAGALAVNVANAKAHALTVGSTTINGNLTLAASNNMDAKADADGSQTDGTTGIGVAIAINIVDMDNLAVLGPAASVNGGFSATASMKMAGVNQVHDFDAKSKSGASAEETGVAGSFALNYIDADTRAAQQGTVSASANSVSLTASSRSTSDVEAKANAEGGDTGVGASIAINVSDQLVEAVVANGASLTGGTSVTLSATGHHENTTVAEGGADGGGTSVGGSFALSIVDNVTNASIGTSVTAINASGNLSQTATHHGKTETTADGAATGSTAIGASIALAFVDDSATANLNRNATAGGSISLAAHGDGASIVTAKASAEGAAGDGSEGADADEQKDSTTGLANQKSGKSDSTSQGASKDGEGVSVAAALALNVSNSTASATVDAGMVTASGGNLSVQTSNNMDSAATADGSAKTSEGGDAVGVAVAINVADMVNEAKVVAGTDVTANGLTLSSVMKNVGGDTTHTHVAKAASGASGGEIGIAGSFALSVVTSDTTPVFGGTGSTLTLNGGAVDIDGQSLSKHQVLASAKGLSEGDDSTGVGAGIAVAVIFDTTDGGIADNTVMNGTANGFGVDMESSLLPVEADGPMTKALAGAEGSTGVGGAVAVTYVESVTKARVGSGAGNFSMTGGALTVTADHTATILTQADGEAAGDDVGVGVSVALNIGFDESSATVARAMTTGNNQASSANVTTDAIVSSVTESKASAKGQDQKESDGTTDSKTSDQEVSSNTNFAQSKGGGEKSPSQDGEGMFNTADTNATNESGTGMKSQAGGGGNSSGGTSVAATVSVNYLEGSASALIADNANVAASGAVKVETTSQITSKALATATSTNINSDTGVAAAVGLNITQFDASAKIGDATVSGASVSVKAVQPDGESNVFQVRALSGAVSSGTGFGGSISINYVDISNKAEIGDDATITANNGNVTVAAATLTELQNLSGGAAFSTDGAGVGIAVSVNIVNTMQTEARIGEGATVTANNGSVSVTATGSFTPLSETLGLTTEIDTIDNQELALTNFSAGIAASGSDAAVGGSASVNVLTISTQAIVEDDVTLDGDAGVTVSASDTMELFTGAGSVGLSAGGAGVGVSVNVDVVNRTTRAEVGMGADLISSNGNVAVTATAIDTFTSVAATFGVSSDSVALALSISVVVMNTTTEATVKSASGADATDIDAGGNVTVSALGTLEGLFISGGVAASGSSAALGLAAGVFYHDDDVIAEIGNHANITTHGAGGLAVTATSSESIFDLVVAAAISGGNVGIGASALVSILDETTWAKVGSNVDIDAWNNGANDPGVRIEATSDTEMIAAAGAIAVSGGASIGAGVNVHSVVKNTEASIGANSTIGGNPAIPGDFAEGNIEVTAESSEVFKTFAVSAAGGTTAGIGVGADVMVMDLTTRALIGANVTARTEGSVKVQAVDETEIDMITVGAAVGGTAGVGAGVNVAHVTKVIDAKIGAGAVITGEGNSTIAARAGEYGVGTDPGDTAEGVNAGAFEFSGGARPDADDFEVGRPETNTQTDITDTQSRDGDGNLQDDNNGDEIADPDILQGRSAVLGETNVRGVVVSASTKDDVEAYAIGFAGAGTVAVGIGAGVSVATTTATAEIGAGAMINQSGEGHDGQSVIVNAASDFSHVGIGAGGALSGGVSVAPGVNVSVIDQTTTARIGSGVSVDAEEDVLVAARANQNFFIVGAGIGVGGIVGVGGGVAVVSMTSNTTAEILGGTIVAGGDVAVIARNDTTHTVITGGVGAALVGVGASVGVVVINKDTSATIANGTSVDAFGNGAGVGGILTGEVPSDGNFAVGTAGGVIVQATSSESLLNLAISGGGGLVGIAGAVTVTVVDSDTAAVIGEDAQINQGNADHLSGGGTIEGDQGVWVTAANNFSLVSAAAAVAGGFVGVGAGVSYGNVRNNVGALIGTGADVNAMGRVEVTALSNKVLKGYVVAGGVGAVGIGAAVNVFSIGADFDSEYTDEDGNTMDASMIGTNDDNTTQESAVDDTSSGADDTAGQVDTRLSDLNAEGSGEPSGSADNRAADKLSGAMIGASPFNLGSQLSYAPQPEDGVTAVVESGVVINAGTDVEVTADERIETDFITGAAAGGIVGVGAGVTILNVNSRVHAALGASTTAQGNVTVSANGKRVGDIVSVGIQGGLAAVGAGIVVVNDRGTQLAEVTGGASPATAASVDDAATLTVSASNFQDYEAETYSLAFGGVAVGVNFSRMVLDDGAANETVARIGNNVQIGQTQAVGTVTVTAESNVTAVGETYAAVVGAGAIGLNFNFVEVNPQVIAEIGNSADITATGAVSVTATGTMDAHSTVIGIAAGVVAAGGTISRAEVSPDVSAKIGTGFTLNSEGLSVIASHNVSDPNKGAHAVAIAASAAGLLGAAGAVPTAEANADVLASIGSGGAINAGAGAIVVRSDLRNRAEVDAIAFAAGLAGLGASVGIANADGTSIAKSQGTITGGGSLTIEALANNDARAESQAASGGLIGGAAHVALASASPTEVTALLDGNSTVAGVLEVNATSKGKARAQVESLTVGLAASIGYGQATATVSPTVKASIEGGNIVAGSVSVQATHNKDVPPSTYRAYAKTEAAGLAFGGSVQVNTATANANATVDSFVLGGVNIDTDTGSGAGMVQITATNVNTARAFTTGLNIGILGAIGVTIATANANGDTTAEIRNQGAAPAQPDYTIGSLRIEAVGQNTASATVEAASGGLLAAADNTATANSRGDVTAEIGTNLVIQADGGVTVKALGTPEVDASSKGVSGGGIQVGLSQAYAMMDPTITARIDTGTMIDAAGDVRVEADVVRQTGAVPTYVITQVDTGADTLQVLSHNLSTGDIIEIGNNGRDYNIIVVGENNDLIALGNTFEGGTTVPNSESGVNGLRDTITFPRAHNYQNGDFVRLTNLGTGSNIAAQGDYYVRVVDSDTIKLVDSFAKSQDGWFEANANTFNRTDVTPSVGGSWIDIGPNSYSIGDVLTYQAPDDARVFGVGTVNVSQGNITDAQDDGNPYLAGINNGNNRIYFVVLEEGGSEGNLLAHNLTDGQQVVYTTTDASGSTTGNVVGGLEEGRTYFVVNADANSVQLKRAALVNEAVYYEREGASTYKIVLTDGSTWDSLGYQAGDTFTISNSNGNNGDYEVASVNGAELTLDGSTPLSRATRIDQSMTVDDRDVDPGAGTDLRYTLTLSSGNWGSAFTGGGTITLSGLGSLNGTRTIHSVSGNELTLTLVSPGVGASVFAGAQVQLQNPEVDTFDTDVITLSPDKDTDGPGVDTADRADSSLHKLTPIRNAPLYEIVGGERDYLENGEVFYVVGKSGDEVRLSRTSGGAAIDVFAPSNPGNLGGVLNHRLGAFGIDLTQTTADDQYGLRIHVSGGVNGQTLHGEDGIDLATVSAGSGDGTSAVVVKGSGGGLLFSGNLQEAKITAAPDVKAEVLAEQIISGNSVFIHADADVYATANGRNGNGGLIAFGSADTRINQGAGPISATVVVGDGTKIIADNDLVMTTGAGGYLEADSKTTTGGAIGIARAKALIDGDFISTITVADDALVIVGDLVSARAVGAGMTGMAKARATGIGIGGDGDGVAEYKMESSDVGVSVGEDAIIEGAEVKLVAINENTHASADGDGRGGGFYAEGEGESRTTQYVTTDVTIASGAKITGWEGVDFIAINRDNFLYGRGFGRSTGLFGYVSGDSFTKLQLDANVNGAAGALVTAGPRDESGAGDLSQYDYDEKRTNEMGAVFTQRLALFVKTENAGNDIDDSDTDVSRRSLAAGGSDRDPDPESAREDFDDEIAFSSDVLILSGRSPDLVTKTLVIGMNDGFAQIERAINVTVDAAPGNTTASAQGTAIERDRIYVNDIANQGPGDVAFLGSNISGSTGTWTFRETLQRIEILNTSNVDIVINNIDVLGTTRPIVTLNEIDNPGAANVTIDFHIETDVAPTYIQIANTGDADIYLAGEINNPIGVTSIVAQNGSVLKEAGQADSVVRTETLNIDASEDAGASDASRVVVQMVESEGVPEGFSFRTGQVSGLNDRIFLGLGNRFHEGQMVQYQVTSGNAIGGLSNNGYYYVSFDGDAYDPDADMIGVKLYDNAELSGDAIDIFVNGDADNTHTLTGVESFTVDAGDDAFLDMRALLRKPLDGTNSVGGVYIINIDRIAAGDDIDAELRPTFHQTGAGEQGGVIVKHPVGNKDPETYFYYTHFAVGDADPESNPGTGISRGVYAEGTSTVKTTYDFRGLDLSGDRTLAGLQAGFNRSSLDADQGNILVQGVGVGNSAADSSTINVLGLVELEESGVNVGDGDTSVITDGYIALTEITGDFRIGTIDSNGADVLLYSPQRFIDADGDGNDFPTDVPDISGNNITLVAASSFVNPAHADVATEIVTPTVADSGLAGGIGRSNNFIELNMDSATGVSGGVLRAFDATTNAANTQGIFLDEVVGDMRVYVATTVHDVSLRTTAGSIIDGNADNPFAANVIGRTIDLDANGLNASIGTSLNPFEIDSRNQSGHLNAGHLETDPYARIGLAPVADLTDGSADDVGLEATRNIYLTEVKDELRLVLAHTYEDGAIVITVRERGGMAGATEDGEDLQLVQDGSVHFGEADNAVEPGLHDDAFRPIPHGLILAEQGTVTLQVGDDIATHENSAIVAGKWIKMFADFLDLDAGFGAEVILRGQIIAGAVMVVAGNQTGGPGRTAPIGTFRPNDSAVDVTDPNRITSIYGNGDIDVFQFGDTGGSGGTTTWGSPGYIYLGSKTRVYGDATSDATVDVDDGEDHFVVYYLQDAAAQTSPAIQTIAYTSDPYNSADAFNSGDGQVFNLSVLAEHTLTLDGLSDSDTYEVYTLGSQGDERNYIINVLDTGAEDDGVDELTVYGFDSDQSGSDGDGDKYPIDDIFLLRAAAYLPNETASRPGYVAMLHGTVDPYQDVIFGNEDSVEVQRISYDDGLNGRLTVEGLGGNDAFFSDDVTVIATLDGGEGDDTFQIGQIFGANRTFEDGNLLPQDEFPDLKPTTRGWLSQGSSAPLLVQGGTGHDEFRVYSNQSELRLEGDDGNDLFIVRAFAIAATTDYDWNNDGEIDYDDLQAGVDLLTIGFEDGGAAFNAALAGRTDAGTLPALLGGVYDRNGDGGINFLDVFVTPNDTTDDVIALDYDVAATTDFDWNGDGTIDGADLTFGLSLLRTGFEDGAAAFEALVNGQSNAAALKAGLKNGGATYVFDRNNDETITLGDLYMTIGDDSDDVVALYEEGVARPQIGLGFSVAQAPDIRAGGGQDEVRYNVNAPVSVDGGTGFDKLVILGTEFADDIVITDKAIYGAGLNVRYANIEVVEVDGLEGDDKFFVLSTAFGVAYRVIGGLGSDTIKVAGDVQEDIITRELEGVSGAVDHLVTSDDILYNGIVVDGLDYNVVRDGEGLVVIDEGIDGFTAVREGGPNEFDDYNVRLGRKLTGDEVVYVTVSAARSWQEEQDDSFSNPFPLYDGIGDTMWMTATAAGGSVAGGPTVGQDQILTPDYYVSGGYPSAPSTISYLEPGSIEVDRDFLRAVDIDGQTFYVPNRAVVLRFDHTNWDTGFDVHLWAVDDMRSEGDRVVVVQHSVISRTSADYDGVDVRNVEVELRDNDTPGVYVIEVDPESVVLAGNEVTSYVEDGRSLVIEGNTTYGYSDKILVQLAREVEFGDTIVVKVNFGDLTGNPELMDLTDKAFELLDGGTGRFNEIFHTIAFDHTNWDKPVVIDIFQRDDDVREDPQTAVLSFGLNKSSVAGDMDYGSWTDADDGDTTKLSITNRAGSWVAAGFEVGDMLTIAGLVGITNPVVILGFDTAGYTLLLDHAPVGTGTDGLTVSRPALGEDVTIDVDGDYLFPNLRSGTGLLDVEVHDDETAGSVVIETGRDTVLVPTVAKAGYFDFAGNTITGGFDWAAAGFSVGDTITIEGAGVNNGLRTITGVGGTDNTVLTVAGGALSAAPDDYARIYVADTEKTDSYKLRLTKEPGDDVEVAFLTDGLADVTGVGYDTNGDGVIDSFLPIAYETIGGARPVQLFSGTLDFDSDGIELRVRLARRGLPRGPARPGDEPRGRHAARRLQDRDHPRRQRHQGRPHPVHAGERRRPARLAQRHARRGGEPHRQGRDLHRR